MTSSNTDGISLQAAVKLGLANVPHVLCLNYGSKQFCTLLNKMKDTGSEYYLEALPCPLYSVNTYSLFQSVQWL